MKKIAALLAAFALVFGAFGTIGGTKGELCVISASAEEASLPTSGKCGENVTWKLDADGTLTVSGTGEMNVSIGEWNKIESNVKNIVIQDGISSISSYAFQGMSALEEIIIPQSVTSVGIGAFWNCNKLKKVEFPDNIKELTAVFDGCSELEEVILPKKLETIGYFGFDGLTYGLFGNCPKLKTVTIPETVTEIGEGTLGFDYTYNNGDMSDVVVKKIEDLTIQGYKGTAAEKYAKDNGFKFVELKKADETKFSAGDANGDTEINVTDIAVTAAHIKGIKALTDAQVKAADVNNDNSVNVTDIAMMASHIKGIKPLV